MGRLLIIGCGGVAGVAIHKCCQNRTARRFQRSASPAEQKQNVMR